jgi:phospholipid/cholesterol/gamma-HCH transport system substrate-binding protein
MRSFRERDPIRIGMVSIIGLGILFVFVFELKKLPFIARSYKLTAEFADAAGLIPDNEVRVAGIKVGRVSKVELGSDRVFVSMAIARGVKIPNDATAEISLKTILGTKFVVINATGSGASLKEGDRIPLDRTTIPFEIYQIGNTAVDLLTDVNGKQLNQAFDALADATADPKRNLAGTLHGAAKVLETLGGKRGSIEEIITKGEQILATLDSSSPAIEAIIEHSNVVMEVLARRRATVRTLLQNTDRLAAQLGGLLRDKRPQLDTILDDLHATLKIVDASLGQLEEALRIIGPSSEAFARITHNGRWASICTMAVEGQLLPPPLPSNIEIGTGTGSSGPVDCPVASEASESSASPASSARTARGPS